MIDEIHVENWNKVVPWNLYSQVEQDLIISRILVEVFSDDFLRKELRFRGGTALNKLHFPTPLRYSEDIDLVRTKKGPIGKILDHFRMTLEPWLGRPKIISKHFLTKLIFRTDTNGLHENRLRIKIEINMRELFQFDPLAILSFSMENSWYSGQTNIPTYSREEMLATKLRALLQRSKGRDLYDLDHALNVFEDLNKCRVIELFQKYLAMSEQSISKAEAQVRMFQKYNQTPLMADIHTLLPVTKSNEFTDSSAEKAFWNVYDNLICLIPGEDWIGHDDFIKLKDSKT